MPFVRSAKMIVIDESNYLDFATGELSPAGFSRGFVPRDYSEYPEGFYAPVSALPLIPESEWPERIEAAHEQKTFAMYHRDLSNFSVLDQDGTNYCWANAPVAMVHHLRAQQGLPHVPLSPASVAAPIKNYRNQGGWGSEALEYIREHGIAPQSLWPANAISRKYDTPECRAERVKYLATEVFEELPNRSYEHLVTMLLLGYSVAVGYNWWHHEVLAVGLASKDETIIDNSWTPDWGDNGRGILTRKKAVPDDAVVAREAAA